MMVEVFWRVSGGGRFKFVAQGGLVLITVDNCSSSNSRGNRTWVKGGSAWNCVCLCVCGCNLPEFPSCPPALHKQPSNFLPNHTTVPPCTETLCAFDCCLILQCSCSLAKGVGLTCYLGQRFSVFSISGTSRHLMRFFSLQNEKFASGNTCHTHLKYKMNSNCGTFKWVVGWRKDNISPLLYFRDIEWWTIYDEPK